MFAFALAIFSGAFLLFQVQPLIAKYILPWFGGAPAVWTTCMLFFQVLLLAGYAYAHLTSRWLKPRAQAILHLLLLAGALALLPIIPSNSWKPTGTENPTLHILALLLSSLGLPYFVLSSTGPLMQQWFSRTNPGRSPYRLYALSNVGSLLALLSFPFFFETHLTRKAQASLWGWGLAAFTVFCGFCAWKVFKSQIREPKPEENPKSEIREPEPALAAASGTAGARGKGVGAEDDTDGTVGTKSEASSVESVQSVAHAPSVADRVLWLLLPACASVLLLAVTNKLCQDVAVIPFLWVLPLSLYLLSFIICFDSSGWYGRMRFGFALALALGAVCWALPRTNTAPLRVLLTIYSTALFVCCMICHGELYRLRPGPNRLTSYYLTIAAGGALGGILVVGVAPLIFNDYYELQWGLLGCAALFFVLCLRSTGNLDQMSGAGFPTQMISLAPASSSENPDSSSSSNSQLSALRQWHRMGCTALAVGLAVLSVTFWLQLDTSKERIALRTRNFYGVLTIFNEAKDNPTLHHLTLNHGQTIHGSQFVRSPENRWPTTYYSEQSGVGLAMAALPQSGRRVGLVGLGIGTLAAYARTNDTFRFYEINPEVLRLASSRFTYLTNCPGKLELVLGDARLSLEKEAPQQFDLLVLDAFSGDAVPAHLLTREAFSLYARHLKTNGVIAVHVSNRSLDLEPVLVNVARACDYHLAAIESDSPGRHKWWIAPRSIWVLLTRDRDFLNTPPIRNATRPPHMSSRLPLWTDDFTSLFQVLR